MTDPALWQTHLDPPLLQRLLRPWQHPGRIDPGWANRIVNRYQNPLTPLPLVDRFVARQRIAQQSRTASQQPETLPLVFAQPLPPAASATPELPTVHPRSPGNPIVIQAKLMDSAQRSGLSGVSPTQTSSPTVLPLIPLTTPVSPPAAIAPAPTSQFAPPSFVRIRRAGLQQQSEPQSSPAPFSGLVSSDPESPVLPLIAQTTPPVSESAPALSATALRPVVTARSRQTPDAAATRRDPPLVQAGRSPAHRQNSPVVLNQGEAPIAQPIITRPQTQPPLVFSVASGMRSGSGGTESGALSGAGNPARYSTGSVQSRSAQSGSVQSLPIVGSQAIQSPQTLSPPAPPVDIDALAAKVERKLLRKLVVERERRGGNP